VEIETGKSNWKKNIQKNQEKGLQNIKIITTNDKTYKKRLYDVMDLDKLIENIKI
jgi:hypothetical protein